MIKLKKGDKIYIQRRVLDMDNFNVWTEITTTTVESDFATVGLVSDGIKCLKGMVSHTSFYLFPEGHSCPMCTNGNLKYIYYCDKNYQRTYKLEDEDEDE